MGCSNAPGLQSFYPGDEKEMSTGNSMSVECRESDDQRSVGDDRLADKSTVLPWRLAKGRQAKGRRRQ